MPRTILTATINAGGTLSNAVDVSLATVSFLFLPSAWTPALLSFQASPDNVTFADLVDANTKEISINVVAGTVIKPIWIPVAIGWLKFRSGSRDAPVIQTANRVFSIAADT